MVLDGVLDVFLGCWMHYQGVGWVFDALISVGFNFRVLDGMLDGF